WPARGNKRAVGFRTTSHAGFQPLFRRHLGPLFIPFALDLPVVRLTLLGARVPHGLDLVWGQDRSRPLPLSGCDSGKENQDREDPRDAWKTKNHAALPGVRDGE